jgi:hypothetical protein
MSWFWPTVKRRIIPAMMAAIALFVLGFSTANPALAFGNSTSQASEGTAQMNELQETSKRALQAEPRSGKRVQEKARRGPNEVQGDASLRDMNAPKDSSETTTVRKQVERALEKVTPGD